MSFVNPFSVKTATVSTIPAAEVNAAGVSISRALDGTNGGTYTLASPLTLNSSTVTIATLSAGTATITTQLIANANIVLNSASAVIRWRALDVADGSFTVDTTYDTIYVPSTLTANRAITLRRTTAPIPPHNSRITVVRRGVTPSAHTVTILGEGGTPIAVFPASQWASAEFEFNAFDNQWRTRQTSGNVTVSL